MGGRFTGGDARQHPDLTAPAPSRALPFVLVVLAFDGVLSAVAGSLLLPNYIGGVPFPVSALICGLVNAALVWAALKWTSSPRVAAIPLYAWLATVAALSFGGPGGDIIISNIGLMLSLIVLGAAPPAFVLRRHAKVFV